MAKRKQYALLDSQVKAFLNPFPATNHGEAVRVFTTWVNDTNETNVSKYPHQFTLFYLGEFDDQFGTWEQPDGGNQEIMAGVSVVEDAKKKFTVEELLNMLEMRLGERGAIDISKSGEK